MEVTNKRGSLFAFFLFLHLVVMLVLSSWNLVLILGKVACLQSFQGFPKRNLI